MTDKIALTQVAAELRALTGSTPPKHMTLWRAVVDGEIEAELINGRYVVARAALPKIAAKFGMTVPGATPQRRRKIAAETA
jgi:Na+/H+ antiporter NhaA